jgi:hypothetical protein
MKTIYKNFTIKYSFVNSFWTNESMTVQSINREMAVKKVIDEVSKAYGSEILKDLKIKEDDK